MIQPRTARLIKNGYNDIVSQIDSWWYFEGSDGGVKNWTARPDIFPNGINAVVDRTGWPIVAHNRWWYVAYIIFYAT